jgi:hypothetical protein
LLEQDALAAREHPDATEAVLIPHGPESVAPSPAPSPAPDLARRSSLSLAGTFAHDVFHFTTGLRAGEIATIRGEGDQVLLTYRSFASITGVIAAFVSSLMIVAGLSAVLLLWTEGSILRAMAALGLTIVFAIVIGLLVPRIQVTLFDNDQPALTLKQVSTFPSARYVVTTPNGTTLAEFRKSVFSRLGRHRWTIWQSGRYLAEAVEDSFFGAWIRKFLGKFSRTFETNIAIEHGGSIVGRIPRRTADRLELLNEALDRRIAVALATLILGREP